MKHSLKSSLLLIMLIILLTLTGAALADGGVRGTVWVDKNADGILDEDEKGLGGVTVTVEALDENGSFYTYTQDETDKNGAYALYGLVRGQYRLRVELPKGYLFTLPGGDSCMLPASGTASVSPAFEAGDTDEEMNIGVITTNANVQVVVFEDANANGGRMLSEPLLRNVEVELQYLDGEEVYTIATGTTNKDGEIRIQSLSPADYRIKATLPEGYVSGPMGQKINAFYNCALPSDGPVVYTDLFHLNTKESVGIGIGAVKTGSLTGFVWYDANCNGVMDVDEGGREGVTLVLTGDDDGRVLNALTDQEGIYTFDYLREGTYQLSIALTDDIMYALGDSAVVYGQDEPLSCPVSISVGKTVQADAFGVMPDTGIVLHVFDDRLVNGIRDSSEAPIEGISFTLTDALGNQRTAVSGPDGTAAFHGLPEGTAVLACAPGSGYVFTKGTEGALAQSAAGQDSFSCDILSSWGHSLSFDIGLTQPAAVEGTVYEDPTMTGVWSENAQPLANLTVQVLDQFDNPYAETLTDENGFYRFDNLLGGEYKIRLIFKDPYIACPYAGEAGGDRVNQILTQSMDHGDSVYFTLFPQGSTVIDMALYQAGSVSGQILFDPAYAAYTGGRTGLEGIELTLLDENGQQVSDVLTTVTNASGAFRIKGIMPGQYRVHYALPDNCLLTALAHTGAYTGDEFTVTIGNEVVLDPLSAILTARAEGRIYRSLSGGVQEGVEAAITFTGPDSSETVITGQDGQFAFDNMMPGDYDISLQIPEGYIIADAHDDFVAKVLASTTTGHLTLMADDDLTQMDVLVSLPSRIRGSVYYDANANSNWDSGETAVSKTPILLKGPETDLALTTDESGAYLSEALLPGEYTLTLTLDDQEIVMGQDYADDHIYTVSVTVGDGETLVRDVGILRFGSVSGSLWDLGGDDSTLPKAEVTLLKDGSKIAAVTTDGAYFFDRLYPGTYTLSAAVPEGTLFARETDTGARRSMIIEGASAAFTLNMGDDLKDMDIGIGMLGSVGDFAWLDLNGNGMQDIGEPGLPLVKIELWQEGVLIASAETDVYGYWRLTDIYPGRYDVHVYAPDEVLATTPVPDFPLVTSILPARESGEIVVEGVYVPSGKDDMNCDFGFVLKEEGVYPESIDLVPVRDWTPYTERKK